MPQAGSGSAAAGPAQHSGTQEKSVALNCCLALWGCLSKGLCHHLLHSLLALCFQGHAKEAGPMAKWFMLPSPGWPMCEPWLLRPHVPHEHLSQLGQACQAPPCPLRASCGPTAAPACLQLSPTSSSARASPLGHSPHQTVLCIQENYKRGKRTLTKTYQQQHNALRKVNTSLLSLLILQAGLYLLEP